MTPSAENDSNFLILGHNGYLGRLILSRLKSLGLSVRVLNQRLTCENVKGLMKENVDDRTRIFNCVASGVTPNTSDSFHDFYTNHQLLESQLNALTNLEISSFTHFASNYEVTDQSQRVVSRNSYVQSKTNGSIACMNFLEHDRRIKLMYLPTVIDSSQPKGRLFADFIHASFANQAFLIQAPELELQSMTFESLWNIIEVSSDADDDLQVIHAPADVRMTVFAFVQELNLILLELNRPPVTVLTPDAFDPPSRGILETTLPYEFRDQLMSYVKQMIGE